MDKVLIIGASGFLGKELYTTFKLDKNYDTSGTYSSCKGNDFEHMDITDLECVNYIFDKIKPQIVIVTAALTNVEYCETHKEETYKINVSGIKNILILCKQYGCRVIYISTEYVFDGEHGPYSEEDKENPINNYGKDKLEAELLVKSQISEYLIVRTTVVYGWDLESKNFIMQLIQNLGNNNSMKVPIDQISSPTYCPNLAIMIKECVGRNITGKLNIVGNEIIDRYRFAVKAAEVLGLRKELIIPVKTDILGQVAKRPLNAGLKPDKALSLLDFKPTNIEDSLKEVKEFYIKYKNHQDEGAIYE